MASSTILPIVGLLGAGLEVGPAGLGGHPEDVLGLVFVRVFGIGAGVVALAGEELGAVFLEGVGDVFEEDQAEDDVLVLRRVHVVAQLVRGEPELGFEAEIGGGVFVLRGGAGHGRRCSSGPMRKRRGEMRNAECGEKCGEEMRSAECGMRRAGEMRIGEMRNGVAGAASYCAGGVSVCIAFSRSARVVWSMRMKPRRGRSRSMIMKTTRTMRPTIM